MLDSGEVKVVPEAEFEFVECEELTSVVKESMP